MERELPNTIQLNSLAIKRLSYNDIVSEAFSYYDHANFEKFPLHRVSTDESNPLSI
jgi:hypothetical protein